MMMMMIVLMLTSCPVCSSSLSLPSLLARRAPAEISLSPWQLCHHGNNHYHHHQWYQQHHHYHHRHYHHDFTTCFHSLTRPPSPEILHSSPTLSHQLVAAHVTFNIGKMLHLYCEVHISGLRSGVVPQGPSSDCLNLDFIAQLGIRSVC